MPVARTAVGCVVGGLLLIGLILLVRPLIYTLAPPRGDDAVAVASVGGVTGPTPRTVALIESHGLDGEVPAPDGHVELTVIVAPAGAMAYTVVAAASPVQDRCPVVIEASGSALVDCAGRGWRFDGTPLDPSVPPLQRFTAHVEAGVIIVDMTQPAGAAPS